MTAPGRPTVHTPELAAEIARRLAEGEPLDEICADAGMPPASTVRGWALDDRGGFAAEYARARQIQADGYVEELITIADGVQGNPAEVAGAKLRLDARKWIVSKILPRYAEKTILEGGDKPLKIEAPDDRELGRRVALLMARADRNDEES